ncbi:hypothetical protein B0H19DRAFT_1196102 [Mycena capillaripes]|nr:hypothetical protein B0H19DRAFT_1196102 [Mycena capillaripes]
MRSMITQYKRRMLYCEGFIHCEWWSAQCVHVPEDNRKMSRMWLRLTSTAIER